MVLPIGLELTLAGNQSPFIAVPVRFVLQQHNYLICGVRCILQKAIRVVHLPFCFGFLDEFMQSTFGLLSGLPGFF